MEKHTLPLLTTISEPFFLTKHTNKPNKQVSQEQLSSTNTIIDELDLQIIETEYIYKGKMIKPHDGTG